MNLPEELRKAQHKSDWLKVAAWVGSNPERFAELMSYFFADDYRMNQRASTILMHCFDQDHDLILPYLPKIIENIQPDKHDAMLRNSFRMLQFVEIPEHLKGKVVDKAFLYFGDDQQAIAIRVFAMTVIYNNSLDYPELQNELAAMIEERMPYGSAGFKNRGGKILAKIRKNQLRGH